jgi:hypothetical protein
MAAAVARTSPISGEFELMAKLIADNTDEEGLRLDPDKARTLIKRLNAIRQKIALLEDELGIHRILEQDQAVGGILGDLTLEVMQDGLLEGASETPVVYPDFTKGKRS